MALYQDGSKLCSVAIDSTSWPAASRILFVDKVRQAKTTAHRGISHCLVACASSVHHMKSSKSSEFHPFYPVFRPGRFSRDVLSSTMYKSECLHQILFVYEVDWMLSENPPPRLCFPFLTAGTELLFVHAPLSIHLNIILVEYGAGPQFLHYAYSQRRIL